MVESYKDEKTMGLSRRDLMKSPLALAGTAAVGVVATTEAVAQSVMPGGAYILDLWPRPPAGQLNSAMAEFVEQTARDPSDSNKRMKGISRPRLMVFPATQPNGGAMLIIPGGGFAWNYFESEGVEAAAVFNRAGITCFVLLYRLPQDGWTEPANVSLADAQRAMRVIRARAAGLRIDPARLGVMGFSAGGFLTATLGTRHAHRFYGPVDETDLLSARPLFAAPIYPVQSVDPAYAYEGVAPSLFGGKVTPALIKEWSPDQNVTAQAVPTFLAHAEDDGLVSVANTVRLRDALAANGIPVETHLFARGGHGFGVHAGGPGVLWTPLFLAFAREQGLFT